MASLKRLIPNRRLSSKAVQNQLQSAIVNEVLTKELKVVAARLVWKTSKPDLKNARLLLTNKRNFADSIVARQHDVLFFFSCLSSIQERKRKRELNSDNDEDEEELFPTIYPSINYWIVTLSKEDDVESVLFRQLLDSGLDIDELKPIRSRKKTSQREVLTATLCTCVQDYNNNYVKELMKKSIDFCTEELLGELLHEHNSQLRSASHLTGASVREQVIRIVNCDIGSQNTISNAVKGLNSLGLDLQVMESPNLPGDVIMRNQSSVPTRQPENKILAAIRTVEKSMLRLKCSLHQGDVYVKPACSEYTYVYYKNMTDFLQQLSGNQTLAETLVGHIPQITQILSSPSCAVIPQIKIDMNLIEVQPSGTCFDIVQKAFVKNPIAETDRGKISPRAFVKYEYNATKVPQPSLFISGLKNSFPDETTRVSFMRKYYQLLCTGHFQHKTRKLCVIGPKDSGKTTWIAPLHGIIPVNRIATVTRERQFSTQCINDATQLVFIDEWSSQSLDVESAKKLFQGGFYVASVKHQKPTTTILKCPFYLTANEMPQFTETDDSAIQARLAVFETTSISKPIPRANEWLRKNCMQVFHYLADELQNEPLFSDDEDEIENEDMSFGEGAVFNDYDRAETSLISTEEINCLELHEDDEQERTPYDPQNAITKEDEVSLVKAAIRLEPERYNIDHRLQITHGPTSSPEYLKSVMLMILSKLRVLRLDTFEEMKLQMLADENSEDPNAALDAWLLINGRTRKQFDVDILCRTYPGMRKYINNTSDDQNTEQQQDDDATNSDNEGDGDRDDDDGDKSDDERIDDETDDDTDDEERQENNTESNDDAGDDGDNDSKHEDDTRNNDSEHDGDRDDDDGDEIDDERIDDETDDDTDDEERYENNTENDDDAGDDGDNDSKHEDDTRNNDSEHDGDRHDDDGDKSDDERIDDETDDATDDEERHENNTESDDDAGDEDVVDNHKDTDDDDNSKTADQPKRRPWLVKFASWFNKG